MEVAKISQELAQKIAGKEYANGILYNPVQDGNGDWIISLQEAAYLDNTQYEIIKYVPVTEEEI